jgi:hypothetical protein
MKSQQQQQGLAMVLATKLIQDQRDVTIAKVLPVTF